MRRLVVLVIAFLLVPVASAAAEQCLVVLECADGPAAPPTPPPTVPPSAAPTTTVAPAPVQAPRPVDATGLLVDLANRERTAAGLAPLRVDGGSNAIAAGWSGAMADRGVLAHNDAWFTAGNRSRLGARLLGENVAFAGSLEAAHATLMASPHHRDNLLDARFTVVGMAAVERNGLWWVTQDFAQVANPAPAPSRATAPATPTPSSGDVSTPKSASTHHQNEVDAGDRGELLRWVAAVAQRSWASACSRMR